MGLQGLSGRPVFQFKPRVLFKNGQVLHAGAYGIRIPQGLSPSHVPAPIFVNNDTMNNLAESEDGGHGGGSLVTQGLTVAKFAVSFANSSLQWRQVPTGTIFPFWQFHGGDIFLETTIAVYVHEGYRPTTKDPLSRNNALSRRRFAIIMEHELLHVLDEIDIVSRWMTPQVYGDQMVLQYLTNAEPVDDPMFKSWFEGAARGFSRWLESAYWRDEHNKRIANRDAAEKYRKIQQQIDEVSRQMH